MDKKIILNLMRKIKMTRQMTKKEWLGELVFRDLYGRTHNLSDVPMTMMTRQESFDKQRVSQQETDKFWKQNKQDYSVKVG